VTELFDSAWLKIAWAVKHGDALNENLIAFWEQTEADGLYTTTSHYDAKGHCVVFTVESITPTPPIWGLQLGDVIHNIRSALDHLAWALVKRGDRPNLTKDEATKVYFPLASSPSHFQKLRPTYLPGVKFADWTLVRKYQPYFQGKRRYGIHAFSLLADLSNDDKHRAVKPILVLPVGGVHEIGQPTDCFITRLTMKTPREALKIGTELQRVYVKKTGPNPQLQMKTQLRALPALSESTLVEDWLHNALSFTVRLLREFSEPPDDVFKLAPGLPPLPWPEKPPPPARGR
jgi:hypothetical protein